jgi:ABC-type cobalt transport system, ATPase component
MEIKPSDERSDADNIRVVELFKRDANTLSQQDLDKMKSFLNDKIQSRKNDYQEDNKTIQMTTILREALDYRDWFQFRLFYTQIGKNKRPLTSAVFNRFSGGEKAVTMYTPLFVAMSARYDNANDSAPKIITLDEAFAGIDERNISELFKTIGRLNFNYVMNSQQLQAEYSTVSSLNTYELLRPQGEDGNIVTTIKMHWDSRK